jgi:hypothetical protein
MFSFNQLQLFFLYVGIGACGGCAHELFSVAVYPFKGKTGEGRAWLFYEFFFFIAFSVAFIAIQAGLGVEIRGYAFVGLFGGFLLYYKILRIMLAFFRKVCYNSISKLFRKRKNSVK